VSRPTPPARAGGRGHPILRRGLPWLAAGLAAALAALVGALGLLGGRAAPAPLAPTDAVARNATVTIDLPSLPSTLDPWAPDAGPLVGAILQNVWPGVYDLAPGLRPQLAPGLVQSAEVVGVDPQVVVYHLNPKAVWSDGVPIRADVFVALWQHLRADAGYDDIASVQGSDDGLTVTVTFQTPDAAWPALFDLLPPVPALGGTGWQDALAPGGPAVEVSGGPFEVASFDPGRQLVLVKNPDWWGPQPALARVILDAVPSATQAVAQVDQGSAQAASPDPFDLALLDAASSAPAVHSTEAISPTTLQLVFDTLQGPTAQLPVRAAIAHLVDRPALVQRFLDPLDPSAGVQQNFFFVGGQAGYQDDGAAYAQPDPTQAAADLQAAGLTRSPNGPWELGGQPLVLTLTWAAGDPWAAQFAQAIAGELEADGFAIRAQPVATASLAGHLQPGGTWDLAVVSVPTPAFPSLLDPLYSTQAAPVAGSALTDWSGFDDPRVDHLLDQAAAQLNQVQAQTLTNQADRLLWADLPALPLASVPRLALWSASLQGLTLDPGGGGILDDLAGWQLLRRTALPEVAAGRPRVTAHPAPSADPRSRGRGPAR
jgi:peptide/nickel transport system substrate-binding protein